MREVKINLFNIIIYDDVYRDAMISMIKEARISLGLEPNIREDLYDVKKNYLDKGDGFFLALQNNEVIGCLGFSLIPKTYEAFLHRFYIKASLKHQGIGSKLLKFVENKMKMEKIKISKVHLGGEKDIWFESYNFYPKHGYSEYEPRYMKKEL